MMYIYKTAPIEGGRDFKIDPASYMNPMMIHIKQRQRDMV